MLNFLKKYPMSILLAIIALNLFFISGSLRENAKRNKIELLCSVLVSIEALPEEKKELNIWGKTERIVEVYEKIEQLVVYDRKYGVDVADVCLVLKQY